MWKVLLKRKGIDVDALDGLAVYDGDQFQALTGNFVVRGGILSPRLVFTTRIVLGHWLLQKAFGIEVKELIIGELSKLIFNVEIILLGGQVVGRGEGIEIGKIVRDVGSLSRFVAIHGCNGCFDGGSR